MNAATDNGFLNSLPQHGGGELMSYWRAINRYRLGIILFVIAVGILASVYASSLRPVYRGTATILLDPGAKKKSVTNEDMYDAVVGTNRDYYLTQIEVMKSRNYAERLVRDLKLAKHPEYDLRQRREETGWLNSLLEKFRGPAPAHTASDEEIAEGAVAQVIGQLTITPTRQTQIVKVTFDSHDPQLAERVPNALAKIYIEADMEERSGTSLGLTRFLSEQAAELKQKLAESEQELQQYRESQKIVVTKGQSGTDTSRRLDDLTASLEDARRKRSAAETVNRQVTALAQGQSSEALESMPALQRDPVLLRRKEAEVEAERRLSEAAKRYGPDHPKMAAMQSDLKTARDGVRAQISTVAQTVAKEYEAARASEAAAEQAYARARAETQVFNRAEFPLTRLERNVESNRRLYEAFMQRSTEVSIGEVRQPIARVIDPARLPAGPTGPDKRKIVLSSMLWALMAAVGIALLVMRLDNRVKTRQDMEAKLEIKAAGVVPRVQLGTGVTLERMVVDDNANLFSEAIRSIRSDVQLSSIDSPHKTVLVTSTVSGEGKTTVACNLAFAFSQVKKTLLIEADMRKPAIARLLGLELNHAGLSEFVSGDMRIEQCTHPVNNTALYVLPSGRVPLNPLEMLSSQHFADALESLKKVFEVIIIDSPPVEMVSDPLVLSRFATAVLFVVRADHTPYPLARQSLLRLRRINAPVLGAVLNQFDYEDAHGYYGDYGAYGGAYYHNPGTDNKTGGLFSRIKASVGKADPKKTSVVDP